MRKGPEPGVPTAADAADDGRSQSGRDGAVERERESDAIERDGVGSSGASSVERERPDTVEDVERERP
jgi:hypothetical protein